MTAVLTPVLTFQTFGLLPKRPCDTRLSSEVRILACLTSAALIPSPSVWQWPFWSRTKPPFLRSWNVKWQLCMRSGSVDGWFRTLTRSHYFFFLLCLHLSSMFEKSRKQYNLVPQIEMIMKLPSYLFSFLLSSSFPRPLLAHTTRHIPIPLFPHQLSLWKRHILLWLFWSPLTHCIFPGLSVTGSFWSHS